MDSVQSKPKASVLILLEFSQHSKYPCIEWTFSWKSAASVIEIEGPAWEASFLPKRDNLPLKISGTPREKFSFKMMAENFVN